jgi:plastocyanin
LVGGEVNLKKIWIGLLLGIFCLLAGCGGASALTVSTPKHVTPTAVVPSPTPSTVPLVQMGAATFSSPMYVRVKAGTAVQFVDPRGAGGTHYIVIGRNGQWAPTTGAPAQLNTQQGILFQPGTTLSIVFSTPGTYPITCITHPGMQVFITVIS